MKAPSVLLDPATRRSERMRQLFAEYAPKDLAALESTLSSGERDEIAKAAHRLKGGSYTFGAVRLGDAAAEIERCARGGALPSAEAIAALSQALKETLAALSALPP